MRRIGSGCCARVADGQAVAEPTIALMKSRRRIDSPKGSRVRRPSLTETRLQQGFVTDEMGFRAELHSSNREARMSALGQKQTSGPFR